MTMSDWLAVAGLAVGIAAIPIGYYIARRSLNRTAVSYVIDHDLIIGRNDELLDRGLTLRYAEKSISQVSRSIVAVWNSGNTTIRQSEFLADDVLRLSFEPNDIVLQVRKISESRKEIRTSVALPPTPDTEMPLEFAFMDPGDGFIFDLLHCSTGPPEMLGVCPGVKLMPTGGGRAALTADTLTVVEISGPWRRLWHLLEPRTRISLGTSFGSMLAALTMAVFLLLRNPSRRSNDSTVVNAKDFNLSELAGQRAFAKAVLNSQPFDAFLQWTLIGSAAAIVVATAWGISRLRREARPIIPLSILSSRTFDAPNASPDSAARHSVK